MFAKLLITGAICVGVLNARAAEPDADTGSIEKAIQFPVEKYTLENGLTVLLHPDTTIPAVSIQTWYRVGSKDEVPGHTGLAHFFEHMMFKGTTNFSADTWNKQLSTKGADINAFTSSDYTGYYINAPAENLDFLLQIESDRMRHLKLDPNDVNKEREVVKEERRMRYEDSLEGGLRERTESLLWTKLPYRWLPIGSMVDLNNATMEDLHAFYKEFYSPNNAVLVVAGAIDLAQTKALVQKYYGGFPREEIKRPAITPEPVQTKMRSAVISREAQSPSVAIAYHLPDLKSHDHYALDLLALILGGGNSSRLHQELVYRQEIALAADAGSVGQVLGGEFSLYATLKPKVETQKAIDSIEAQVKNLRGKTVGQKELERARNLLLKDYVDGLKRVSGRARTLANYEILHHDYTRIFTDLKQYREVTPADVQRVAQLYLKPEQRNVVTVIPLKTGGHK